MIRHGFRLSKMVKAQRERGELRGGGKLASRRRLEKVWREADRGHRKQI